MDLADTQRALARQGAAFVRHEQSIQFAQESFAELTHSVNALVQHLGSAEAVCDWGCGSNPEPYDSNLKCRGFVLQCWLVFSQRESIFHGPRKNQLCLWATTGPSVGVGTGWSGYQLRDPFP